MYPKEIVERYCFMFVDAFVCLREKMKMGGGGGGPSCGLSGMV